MRAPRQLFHSMSTLALSVLLCWSFANNNVEASSSALRLIKSEEQEEQESSSSSSSTVVSSYSYYAPPSPDDKTRTIRLWGSLPATYVGMVAEFGNTMQDAFAANLMLPPDDPFLCEFPESFKNITSSTPSSSIEKFPLPYRIALFVSLDGCSAEQKARVALEIRQKVTLRLELLILYSTNTNNNNNNNNDINAAEELVSLQLDRDSPWHNGQNLNGENNLGILHIPQRYYDGIDVNIRFNANTRNADPRMGAPTNEDWKLEIEVAPLGDYYGQHGGGDGGDADGGGYHHTGYTGGSRGGGGGGGPYYGQDDDFNEGSMYFFRIVLFTLLILSPCCRAGYLWHAGGGRFHWRRNDNGRIVGFLYVPPIPAWLSTGGMQQPQDNRAGKLTIEQFNTLPEIKYMTNGSSSRDDDDNNSDCDDSDAADEDTVAANEEKDVDKSKNKMKKTATKTDSTGGESSSSDDEFPSLKQNNTEVTEADSMETPAEIALAPATPTYIHESTEDALEQGNAAAAAKLKDNEKETAEGSVPEAAASDTDDIFSNNINVDNIAQDECPESCNIQSCCPMKFEATKSSMCSICIDDFEEGELLTLLPRCQHAFHKDCILPWLTERQGCCPTCKCSVLEDEGEVKEEEGGGQERNASGNVGDSDSTETIPNGRNNEDAVEPEVIVAPPVPEQSGTR